MTIDWVLANWELALLLITWSAIGSVSIRRQYDWRRRRFTQQVNFSLTTPVGRDGSETLLLRTLLEESAANVWLNEFGVRRVLKAARLTTLEMPFLRILRRHDRDLVLNAVLNVLSERFSDAFLARAQALYVCLPSGSSFSTERSVPAPCPRSLPGLLPGPPGPTDRTPVNGTPDGTPLRRPFPFALPAPGGRLPAWAHRRLRQGVFPLRRGEVLRVRRHTPDHAKPRRGQDGL